MMMIVIVMMIASYTDDDDSHHDDDRIVHSSTIYDAANFVPDGRTNKAILGVGSAMNPEGETKRTLSRVAPKFQIHSGKIDLVEGN